MMPQDEPQQKETSAPPKMAENPNPAANQNIQETSFSTEPANTPESEVGTEITDGEGG